MNIFRLFSASDRGAIREVLGVTGLAGLANVVLLSLINMASGLAAAGQPVGVRPVLMFLVAVGIYFLTNRASLSGANALLQQRLADLKLEIADGIRRSPLRTLEEMGRGEIYTILAQETNYLSQVFPLLVAAAQGLFLVVFCLAYIAILSQDSFVIISFFSAVGVLFFWIRRLRLTRDLASVHEREAAMLQSLSHFSEGFPELRLNADRNDALFRRFARIVGDLETEVVRIGKDWVVLILFSNAFLYAMLGIVVFVLPAFLDGYSDTIYKITAAAIFCIGPVLGVFAVAHIHSRAEIGLGHVYWLQERLAKGATDMGASAVEPGAFADFREIALDGVEFQYEDAQGAVSFRTGPWDLTIRRGELLMLRGGNGVGKSTTLKLLCGLYRPSAGVIRVDGVAVDDGNLQRYREIFSAIFADFHLFDRLHGLETADPERVRALIERMQLTAKVGFAGGRFTTQDLSTGQRKRLAMIVALLEDRPVHIFDEWAADQDAHFRERFYTEILPDLRRQGKSVIVVTHDDLYWDLADRVITLEFGAIVATPGRL
ncbi:hypothetical protein [Azospirillum argentinense]|uniref:cyclic peptide export ABC transporter n=1 Tax=Azospirillum argentinense TaxID=2970906 RepID=UPI0032DF5FE8